VLLYLPQKAVIRTIGSEIVIAIAFPAMNASWTLWMLVARSL